MADYISREPMIRGMQQLYEGVPYNFPNSTHTEWEILRGKYAAFIDYLKQQPAADVQPVKRGYWKDIMMSEATGWDLSLTGGRDAVLETVCSVCGDCCAFGGDGEDYLSPYCPNCGAKMDGEQND